MKPLGAPAPEARSRSPVQPSVAGPLRGALIGFGGVARQAHLPGFRRDAALARRLTVVAAVDFASHLPPVDGLPLLSTLEELEQFGPLDFVDICTPTSSHLELSLWALERGYHVLCEKPVALDRSEYDRLAVAARAAQRVVLPCHQYRYNPVWQRLGQWLSSGKIGAWHLAEFHTYRAMADRGSGTAQTPWRGLQADARGGVLLDHGTHLIYQLLDAAGVPDRVRAWTGKLRHADYDVEDSAQLLFEYPNRIATMFLTWGARHRENRIRFIGSEGSIEWVGGVLRLEHGGQTEAFDYTAELDKAAYPGWFGALFGEFADAIERSDIEAGLADIRTVATVLECAYASARSTCAVRVPDVG